MKLSIIVPVYNMAAEGRLAYCMDSLIAQTVSDYEILAVNDASTDNSLEILRQYEAAHPDKVKVITYERNKRQGGAKNEGLNAAQGEWVGFIDSDDWVTPDFYEKLLQKARETGADMVGCNYSLVTRHTMETGDVVMNNSPDQTGPLDTEKHRKLILRSGSMVIKIYKRSVLEENHLRFPEGIFYEDNCAGPLWSLYFNHFEKVEEPMYYYYQHEISTVHHITEEKCRDRMKAALLFYEECEKRGFLKQYRPEIEYRFIELYYAITLFSYLSGVAGPRLSFIKQLREGAWDKFPDFQENVYYQRFTGEEEKQLIAMQGRSDLGFFLYYRLKQAVRRMKKRLKG